MALNTLKCNHLTPLHFKGLMDALRNWKISTARPMLQKGTYSQWNGQCTMLEGTAVNMCSLVYISHLHYTYNAVIACETKLFQNYFSLHW